MWTEYSYIPEDEEEPIEYVSDEEYYESKQED